MRKNFTSGASPYDKPGVNTLSHFHKNHYHKKKSNKECIVNLRKIIKIIVSISIQDSKDKNHPKIKKGINHT